MKPDIGSESRFLPTPHAFDAPVKGGGPVGILPWYGKTRMTWLPDGENFVTDMFNLFDRMYERDEQTERHRMTAKAALADRRAAKC